MLEVQFYHRDPVLDSNEQDILLLNGPCSESGLCKNSKYNVSQVAYFTLTLFSLYSVSLTF